jgi:hypothetical protein
MINIPSFEGGGYQLEAETILPIRQPTSVSALDYIFVHNYIQVPVGELVL